MSESVNTLLNAVDLLTLDHFDTEWQDELNEKGERTDRHIRRLPRLALLEELREAIWGDTGRTHGGHQLPQERSALDLNAFTLYEDITGRIASHYHFVTNEAQKATPQATLRAWYLAVMNKRSRGDLDDLALIRLQREVNSWVTRITSMFDPHRIKDLAGACPTVGCDKTHWFAPDTNARSTALFVQFRENEAPVVKCRCCGAAWKGEQTLLEMGRYLGATIDEDALREMGVIA